jgi:hypothetical protein
MFDIHLEPIGGLVWVLAPEIYEGPHQLKIAHHGRDYTYLGDNSFKFKVKRYKTDLQDVLMNVWFGRVYESEAACRGAFRADEQRQALESKHRIKDLIDELSEDQLERLEDFIEEMQQEDTDNV